MPADGQILTVAQMRSAEQALIDAGTTVDALMQVAGRGAAEWVWRVAGHRAVTVLCGPGNNGGDGYVIAEALRERGGQVRVIAAAEPKTDAACNARALFGGEVLGRDVDPAGEVLVDCLFGSGLVRPLGTEDAALLVQLAKAHPFRIAIDLPSGVASDSGLLLTPDLPQFHLTVALGAWKFAHFAMPAAVTCGALRLVEIGVAPVGGAAHMLPRPHFRAPDAEAHKYRRGLLAVVGGEMPGASVLSCIAAQGAGAGYVKLMTDREVAVPLDIVADRQPLADALEDPRIGALLVGPGLGRGPASRERLAFALSSERATVIDADALVLLDAASVFARQASLIATPHEGELVALERVFGCIGSGSRTERAVVLAAVSGMIVVAKGPDTVIAAPDGRVACAPRASSWLSTAGTGDVLAGAIASRLATGVEAFAAACEGVWLHGEAARQARAPFTAAALAGKIASAYASAL